MIATLDIEVEAGKSYCLTTKLYVDGPIAGFTTALLMCRITDALGDPIQVAPAGFVMSDVYGPHIHLGSAGVAGDLDVEQIITMPQGARAATFSVHGWRARNVRVVKPMDVVLVPSLDTLAVVQSKPVSLWQSETPAVAGDTYELTATFSRPIAARDIVAAVRFEDAQGHVCSPGNSVAQSDKVGHFLYMTPTDGPGGFAKFRAPRQATTVSVKLIRWTQDASLNIKDVTFSPRSAREDRLASGSLAVQGSGWQTFRADISVMGPEPILIDLVFLDEDDTVIGDRTDGLKRTAQFDNFAQMSPDPLSRHDGLMPLDFAFLMPDRTQTIQWDMFLPDGGAHNTVTPPVLSNMPTQMPLTALAQGDPDLLHALTEQTQHGDTPAYVVRKGYDRLACLATAVEPDAWYTLDASLTRLAGGLRSADVILRVTYFDGDKTRLNPDALAGFGQNPDLGHHCSLCLTPKDDFDEFTASINAPLLTPPSAAYCVFEIIVLRPDSGIDVTPLILKQVTATQACRVLTPVYMTKPQLVQALDIATQANDTGAAHAILSTLAVVDPQTKGYTYRARVLAQHLEIRAPDWLPETGPVHPYSPDPNCIFHLCDLPRVDPTLVAQQVLQGARPVIGVGLTDRTPDAPNPMPYGVTQEKFLFPQTGWDGLSVGDRLSLETRQHSKTCVTHRVDMIHVTTDFKQIEALLKGVALAQHHGLALVIEGIDLVAPSSRAHEDQALMTRCLAAADRIIVSSLADQAIFRDCFGAIISSDLIKRAVDPAFEFRVPQGNVDRLATKHTLGQQIRIGYLCTAEQPDTMLEKALAAARLKPTLVLFGSKNAQSAQALNLSQSGIDHIRMDMNDADPRAWYNACNAIIVPRAAPPSKLIDTTLMALSQGCPVILPDEPDARDLASVGHGAVNLFDPDSLTSLSKILVQVVSGRKTDTIVAQQQPDAERLWTHRIARYDASYLAARAHQQKRRS
jgi:hypothetical protein